MHKIILLIDISEEYGQSLLKGIARYSKEHGPWVFCRMPLFYRETLGMEGILNFAREWGADGMIAQLYNDQDTRKIVEAGIHAVETIDLSVRLVVEKVLALGGKLFITADHGNCETMRNPDGSPNTAHTTNLVHGIYVAADAANYTVRDGILADIAPTLLDMLGVSQPAEMTGRTLLKKN